MGNKQSKGGPIKKRTGNLKEHEIDPEDRKEAVQDLLDSEQLYVDGLKTIVNNFEEPLGQSKKLKSKHHKTIFCNVKLLYEMHTNFLEALQEASSDTECREVGRVIVSSVII